MNFFPHRYLLTAMILFSASITHATVFDDVGYTALEGALGGNPPDGSGVIVVQVEAKDKTTSAYMPDVGHSDFSGTNIVNKTGILNTADDHATEVGRNFYGNTGSMAGGIPEVHVHEADKWMVNDYLGIGWFSDGNPVQPFCLSPFTLASPARVANHSWVGGNPAYDADLLRRLDFVVAADNFIQVAGVQNSSVQETLWSGSFNAITVGRTDGVHATGTTDVDSLYVPDRTCPIIVVPKSRTSYAAPVVAAACSLLVETGKTDSLLSTDPVEVKTADRSGVETYNAACAEVVKAALLAGAVRITNNSNDADILDYRSAPENQSDSGLDSRFGAGQLNINNSYAIIASGEQNSLEDEPGNAGAIAESGFDRDPAFGGLAGSNRTGRYFFTAGAVHRRLFAALVWHLDVDGGEPDNWVDTATLHDLDLALYDVTDAENPRLVAASAGRKENSEHLWTPLVPGRSYRIDVTAMDAGDFLWDYALAWRMDTPGDRDGDGIPDDWEVQFGFDLNDASDACSDTDLDGLDTLGEYLAGTDPGRSDTDGDSVRDGDEASAGTDPLDPDDVPAAVPAQRALGLALLALFLMSAGAHQKLTRS